MKFPEWLYKLLPGDAGTQQLGLIWREATTTSDTANPVSAVIYSVPADKCLVLTNVSMRSDNPTPTITRRRIMADPPAGTVRYNIFDNETNVAANTPTTDNWVGEVVIPGGWRVKVETQFGSAQVGNNVSGEMFGYLIPRGTFVFG